MTVIIPIDGSSLLAQLANPAARALVLAGSAALALAAFRVKTTSARLFVWTSVLYTALAMPLLGRLLPPLQVSVPAFLQSESAPPETRFSDAARPPGNAEDFVLRKNKAKIGSLTHTSLPPSLLTTQSEKKSASGFSAGRRRLWSTVPWSIIAFLIYLVVAVFLLARLVVGAALARRLMRTSHKLKESSITHRLACSARALGLRSVPQIAESEFISVPVTMGAVRSMILLPAGWRKWDDANLSAVLAHEMSHVARRDALTQRLALLHRAIFWFSPLAWWLERHLADLAEQASDEAALSSGADRAHYARTLLGFFEALHAAPGRVRWQGVAMAKAGQAEKRLERILAWRGAVSMSLKKSIAVAIIALAIPVVYLAASVRPASASQRAQVMTPPPPAQELPKPSPIPAQAQPAPASAPTMAPGPPAVGGVPTIPPGPPALHGVSRLAPVAPVPPPAAPVAQGHSFVTGSASGYSYRGNSYAYGDDEQRFVIVSGKSDSYTMSGSSEDIRHVEKLKKEIPGDFIWFQRDEKSYIIRDQATIDRAKKLWAPQAELGRKQEELGKQQEALGKQQEELGKKMEQIQVKFPDMSAELDRLRTKLKQLSSGATMEQAGEVQSEIGELQSKIGELQSQAGEQQSKLGEQMGALGEQQGRLGEQQGELGRQQGELAEQASREMKQLFDDAIKNGTAKPEPESGGSASL